MPYLIFLGVCATWSVCFLFMKKAGLAFSPAAIAAGRVVAGAAVLGLLWGWRDRSWNVRWRDVPALAAVVTGGCAWPYFIQPWVINRNGSAFMALIVSFVPLLTIVISAPVLGVRPTTRQTIGVIGSLLCLGVLLADGLHRSIPAADIALALSVPLGYAAANTIIRRWLAHVTPLALTLLMFVAAAVVLAPVAALTPPPENHGDWAIAVGSLLFLGIVGTGLATLLFNKLIREHGPLFAGMTTNLVPLGAVIVAWFDAEQTTLWQVAALFGILAMVTLVQYKAAQKLEQPDLKVPEPCGAARSRWRCDALLYSGESWHSWKGPQGSDSDGAVSQSDSLWGGSQGAANPASRDCRLRRYQPSLLSPAGL